MKSLTVAYMVGRNLRQEEKENNVPHESYFYINFVSITNYMYSTFRRDCNVELKLCASDDGTVLIVRNICDEHNHPILMMYTVEPLLPGSLVPTVVRISETSIT